MTVKLLAALAATALLTFAVPSFAQEEEVSDDVDIALWCGAAYTVVTKVDGVSEADIAAANTNADLSFAKAHAALVADNIDEAEYDRLVSFYVDAAVEDMTNPDAELRYSDEDCATLIAE